VSAEVSAARLAVFGITGRMGQSLIRALRDGSLHNVPGDFQLSGALASSNSNSLGRDAALEGAATGIPITANLNDALKEARVAIDFSVGEAVLEHARACAQAGVPLLVGTTGLPLSTREALTLMARDIPILIAPNTSVGLSVVAKLARIATAALGNSFDVEIQEAHHRDKRDAPSGTARSLGEAVAEARGRPLSELAVYDRHGLNAPRQEGSIGFSVVRGGDIIGEHTLVFAAAGERVEISHRVSDRQIFAQGALKAAGWLIGRPAGLYAMENVLGVKNGVDSERAHR
jgi:4-hydroxy-tetrahydrodipicolinate reductase